VAFQLTPASHSEQVELRAMLDELFEQTPELAERCADFSADRGLDCAETKAKLWMSITFVTYRHPRIVAIRKTGARL